MAVRLRLTRMGRKKQPFYRIIAVDSREKRDGKFLENIGFYNPVKDPFELEIKIDRALYWLGVGAQPSDTVRSLFRRKGVNLRHHLARQGKSEEEIEVEVTKWEAVLEQRQRKVEAVQAQKMRSQPQAEVQDVEKKSQSTDSNESTSSNTIKGAGEETGTSES